MTTQPKYGRPKTDNPRTEGIRVAFTAKQKNLIRRRAAKEGISMAQWLYTRILPHLVRYEREGES